MADQSYLDTTIREAREVINAGIYKGVKCPCCTQFVKIYKRQIHSTMARMLIELYKLGPGFHHIGDFVIGSTGTNDFSKLRYWELVEEEMNTLDTKRTSGRWAITQTGKDFVEGLITVPRYVEVYDSRPLKMTGEAVSIKMVLGNKFNYNELMGNRDGDRKNMLDVS